MDDKTSCTMDGEKRNLIKGFQGQEDMENNYCKQIEMTAHIEVEKQKYSAKKCVLIYSSD